MSFRLNHPVDPGLIQHDGCGIGRSPKLTNHFSCSGVQDSGKTKLPRVQRTSRMTPSSKSNSSAAAFLKILLIHAMVILAACSKQQAQTLAAPFNPVLIAVSSATDSNFDSLRIGDGERTATGFTHYHVRGADGSVPTFRWCLLTFGSDARSLFCTREGHRAAEPEFSKLASFIDTSLPTAYRETNCSDGRMMPYCKQWKTTVSGQPVVVLTSLQGDGGQYIATLAVHKPMTSK